MRSRVRLLESHVVDQIAAGEVVDRPASVVKELVENALDAGATDVRVQLGDGGRALVRVSDDGHGMDRDDALLAIERHATSKIRRAEDLAGVATLGFRGEALPSIAAVSRFELVTRERGAEAGTRIRIDHGTLTDVREAGAAPGTVVEARALFQALPARRAFLRSAATELAHCVEAVARVALVRPDVGFRVEHEGRTLLAAPAGDRLARAADVLGDEGRKLVPIEVDGPLALVGLAAPPGVHRAAAQNAAYLYVNGRWVRDPVLRRAVRQAYRDLVPDGRHPLVVLDLRVPPGTVDVNVHPTKAEVRFRDPAGIAAFVAEALEGVLPRAARARVPSTGALPLFAPAPEGMEPSASPPPRAVEPPATPPRAAPPPPAPLLVAEADPPAPVAPATERLLGVVRRRWAVVARGDDLVLVDLGRLATRLAVARAGEGSGRLLVPAVVRLPERLARAVDLRAEALADRGLVASAFSPTEVAVRAVPASLRGFDPGELLRIALEDGDWAERLPALEVAEELAPALLADAAALGVRRDERVVAIG